MLDADVTDSVIGEGCVIKVSFSMPFFCFKMSIVSLCMKINFLAPHKPARALFPFSQNCKIHHSVIGLRSCISEGAIIEDTLVMGADYYEVNCPWYYAKQWLELQTR